ncbi:unnamed protein product [Rhodiola kirilowii]
MKVSQLENDKSKLEAEQKQSKVEFQGLHDKVAAEKLGLEDKNAKLQMKVSQLENDKSKLEAEQKQSRVEIQGLHDKVAAEKLGLEDKNAKLQMKVSQLENDKSKLEAEQKQSKVEIQNLHDKVKELEKQSNGKKTHMIPARKLRIKYSGTPQHWTWKSVPDSIYEVAELLHVYGLAINGRLQMSELAPNTTYAAYLVFKLKVNHRGFNNPEGKGCVGVTGREKSINNLSLIAEGQGHHPKRRQDGWMEVELGQFDVKENDNEMEIDFTQITNYVKSGLVVQGIEVRAM